MKLRQGDPSVGHFLCHSRGLVPHGGRELNQAQLNSSLSEFATYPPSTAFDTMALNTALLHEKPLALIRATGKKIEGLLFTHRGSGVNKRGQAFEFRLGEIS